MTPIASFLGLVFDCRSPHRLAEFWQQVLGGETDPANTSDEWVALKGVPALGYVCFQRVPESKGVKNRVHIDIKVDDIASAVQHAEAAGAQSSGAVVDEPGNWFQVMLDPEGNEFCFIQLKPR